MLLPTRKVNSRRELSEISAKYLMFGEEGESFRCCSVLHLVCQGFRPWVFLLFSFSLSLSLVKPLHTPFSNAPRISHSSRHTAAPSHFTQFFLCCLWYSRAGSDCIVCFFAILKSKIPTRNINIVIGRSISRAALGGWSREIEKNYIYFNIEERSVILA